MAVTWSLSPPFLGTAGAAVDSRAARALIDVPPDQLEQLVHPSRQLSAADRMALYADAYFWRLIDVLAAEYPTVRHVVGPERFGELATAYLVAHPSTSYTLYDLGRGFPHFLAHEVPDLEHREVLVDLATVERTIEDVHNAPRADPVALDELLAIPLERWAEARFQLVPAHRLLALSAPVSAFIAAVRQDESPAVPPLEPSWLLVVRRDFVVWRYPQTQPRFVLLERLAAGDRLGEAFEAVMAVPGVTEELLLGQLSSWFQDWMGVGLFARVGLDEGES